MLLQVQGNPRTVSRCRPGTYRGLSWGRSMKILGRSKMGVAGSFMDRDSWHKPRSMTPAELYHTPVNRSYSTAELKRDCMLTPTQPGR